MKHHSVLLLIIVAACHLVAADSEPEGETRDPFSHIFEKALAVSAQYDVEHHALSLAIHNTSGSEVTFNKPALLPAGNIYINADNGSSYPGVGSCILGLNPVALPVGKNTGFQYLVPPGALRVTAETEMSLRLLLDSVNGEKKRTLFTCDVEIVGR
jgi:hypothetical protein